MSASNLPKASLTAPTATVVIRDVSRTNPDFEPVIRPVVPQRVASAPSQSNVQALWTTGGPAGTGPGFFGKPHRQRVKFFRPGTLTAAHAPALRLGFGSPTFRNGRITYVRSNDRGRSSGKPGSLIWPTEPPRNWAHLSASPGRP